MKSHWIVVLYWKSFPMVSTEKLTHAEALACVRSIWRMRRWSDGGSC